MTLLLARDLMNAPVHTVGPTSPLREVIGLMEEHTVRHVPVVDEHDRLLGIVSHRDVLRSQEGSLSGTPRTDQAYMNRWMEAGWLMTKGVRTVRPDAPALEVALTMRTHGCGCVPVVGGGKLLGVVTEADFVEYAIRILSDTGA